MTQYLYTVDPPGMNTPAENKRLGYRTPRSILLPPYLQINNDYYTEFVNAIDVVFEAAIDIPTETLGNLRNMWVTNPLLEQQQIYDSQMIDFGAWSQPERDLLVKQVNALGMKLMNAGIVTNDSYQVISRWVGMYWFGKGTEAFISFINYCLSSSLVVTTLWTQDYVNFTPAGDPTIGTPIWEGGPWYPTTHVEIVAQGGLQGLDLATLISFFYEIANYNLVLYAVDQSFDMWIVDHIAPDYTLATIVAVGLWANNSLVMSNVLSYGADGPPTFSTAPQMPTAAYSVEPTLDNFSEVYLLAQPTGWIQNTNGQTVPVYNFHDQPATLGPIVSPTFMGNQPATNQEIIMILGPFSWIEVPGDTRGNERIPGFAMIPVPRTVALNELPDQIVGTTRNNLLCNPDGWTEMVAGSGLYTPYWNT